MLVLSLDEKSYKNVRKYWQDETFAYSKVCSELYFHISNC